MYVYDASTAVVGCHHDITLSFRHAALLRTCVDPLIIRSTRKYMTTCTQYRRCMTQNPTNDIVSQARQTAATTDSVHHVHAPNGRLESPASPP